ncbi:MAG TPA: hypothetical protein VII51_02060 [Gaiellaceae bacterium]
MTDPATDLPAVPEGKHGDVDINGDLVDELTWLAGPPAMRRAARERRLAAAITAGSPAEALAQIEAVQRLLGRAPA